MRQFISSLLVFTLLLFSGCATLQVNSDYDPEYDFSRLETFTILNRVEKDIVTLTEARLKRAIIETLIEKGYRPAPKEKADFYVIFHTNVTKMKDVITDYDMIGFYPYDYGYWGPPYISSRYEYTYEEAQIVIDTIDPHDRKVFWRGTAVDLLQSFDTPQEREAYISGVVRKVLDSFPPSPQRQRSRR